MRIPVPDAVRYLADPNYAFYMFGNFASSVGVWAQRVAIGWATWELTHSAAWLGLISLAETGPTILLGILAGSILDRVDQLKALRVSQALAVVYAITIAACSWADILSIWLLVFLVALRGAIFVFSRVGRQTILYELVKDKNLASAIALNAMIQNSSRFVGPAIGGAVLAWGGTSWALTVAAGLLAIFTFSLSRLRITSPTKAAREPSSLWAELRSGVGYVAGHAGMRNQFTILIVFSLLASPLSDLFPGIAARIFHQGSSGLAVLLTCHGFGAMTSGLWLSVRSGMIGLTRISLIGILIVALSSIVLVADNVFWLSCTMAFIAGFGYVSQSITNQALIQTAVQKNFRGRVMGFYGMIAQGMPSLGTLGMGWVSDRIGLATPLISAGICCLALWACAWRWREYLAQHLEQQPNPL